MLQALSPELAKLTIQESGPVKDYRYRLVPVAKSAVAQLMSDLVMGIDYTNHKAACAPEPLLDEHFQHALHATWSATRSLQDCVLSENSAHAFPSRATRPDGSA